MLSLSEGVPILTQENNIIKKIYVNLYNNNTLTNKGIFELVDIVLKTWNQLECWVFEKWELINGGEKREIGVVFK